MLIDAIPMQHEPHLRLDLIVKPDHLGYNFKVRINYTRVNLYKDRARSKGNGTFKQTIVKNIASAIVGERI